MAELNLLRNQIGDEGAKYLGEALQKNTVKWHSFFKFYNIDLICFIQTLTELDLSYNEIGGNGARYLCTALEKNTVKLSSSFYLYYLYLSQSI